MRRIIVGIDSRSVEAKESHNPPSASCRTRKFSLSLGAEAQRQGWGRPGVRPKTQGPGALMPEGRRNGHPSSRREPKICPYISFFVPFRPSRIG